MLSAAEYRIKSYGITDPQGFIANMVSRGIVKLPSNAKVVTTEGRVRVEVYGKVKHHFATPKERWDYYNQRAKERRAMGHAVS